MRKLRQPPKINEDGKVKCWNGSIEQPLRVDGKIVCAVVFCIGVYLRIPDMYYPCLIVAIVVVLRLNYLTDKFKPN